MQEVEQRMEQLPRKKEEHIICCYPFAADFRTQLRQMQAFRLDSSGTLFSNASEKRSSLHQHGSDGSPCSAMTQLFGSPQIGHNFGFTMNFPSAHR